MIRNICKILLVGQLVFTFVLSDDNIVYLPRDPSILAKCDRSKNCTDHDGNIGRSGIFPWLGLLRLHIHEREGLKVIAVCIVLIKDRYALVHADDINKVPKRGLTRDSKAVFLREGLEPWSCVAKGFTTHSEYDVTVNTIAVLELDYKNSDSSYHPTPICWSTYYRNDSKETYAIGYTDENLVLDKFIYNIKLVENNLCSEFYNRAGLFTSNMNSNLNNVNAILCGVAPKNTHHCTWENGMALASNSSGSWVLIGTSIAGTGCNGPSRFLNIHPYIKWIEAVTNEVEDNYYCLLLLTCPCTPTVIKCIK